MRSRALIAHHRCGYTVSPGDGEALVDRILELASNRELCSEMGQRAREAFEAEWDKDRALAKWEVVLSALLEKESDPLQSPLPRR